MGPCAITHEAIEAFMRTEKIDLTPWEVRTICAVDDAVIAVWGRETSPDAGTKEPEDAKAALKGIAAMKKVKANQSPK